MTLDYSDHGEAAASIELDPLYAQALSLMQQGQWQEAAQALAVLERRYPEAPELARARQSLALHLSAEQSWTSQSPRRGRITLGSVVLAVRLAVTLLNVPAVRAMLVANFLLYLALATFWVMANLNRLLR